MAKIGPVDVEMTALAEIVKKYETKTEHKPGLRLQEVEDDEFRTIIEPESAKNDINSHRVI